MGKLRLLAVLCFMLFLFAPLYASGTPEEKSADSHPPPIISEKPAEKTAPVIIKTEVEIKPAAAEPEIVPYKSNPVAVKAVEKSTALFAERIRERFAMWLSRSGKYVELMTEILKNKNLPEDIVFLALIESGFNPHAYSVARAVGPWQFMSATAKQYGLVIDWWRDERRDPVKSTAAAANYLSALYEMFGSWDLAMAAYNAGQGTIRKALKRSKSDDYWPLLNTRHIKRETKDYVPRFIAASKIASNPEEFGFKNIEYHEPLNYDEVMVSGPIDLVVAARCADTTVGTIKELNPELRRWSTPPGMPVYILRIPYGTKEIFQKNLAEIPESERFTVAVYTVKKGDTIEKIAKKAGVTVKAVLALNSMERVKPLRSGTKINLPPKEKFKLDRDDRYEIKKASYKKSNKTKNIKTKKPNNKKVLLTALDKKKTVVND
ncbi:MAG: transglycosylase SLT domain-containing protein [Thermodesulfovibrionales bacterium]|nr:transglycosylase SLT domain-containing protein [Thermodesulfovibrionales bacterium]